MLVERYIINNTAEFGNIDLSVLSGQLVQVRTAET